jgi:chromate reductase
MKLLTISGSTRNGSLNSRLARLVADVRPADTVTLIDDLRQLPFYDGDVEAAGVPASVRALRSEVAAADVVVIVTPEYNGSVPGVLANAIDWLSRPHQESVLQDKPVVVLSASPSRYGGVRAAEHLRTVLGFIGATVLPGGISVAAAHERVGGESVDPEVRRELARGLERAFSATSSRGLARAA